MAEDLFETESGLLDDFDFTINKAYFATDMQYMNGEVLLLHLVGETDNPDNPEQHLMIPVGTGWDSADGGKTAVHERGKKKFIDSSIYGRLINRCIDKDQLNLKDLFRKRGSSKLGFAEAKIWEGLRFHMKREKLEFGPGLKATERLMPVAFLGENKPAAKGKVPKAVVETPPEETTEDIEDDAALEHKVLVLKVRALAKQCASYDEFYPQALKVPKVRDHDDLIAAIVDPEGIWAEVHGQS